MTDNTFDFTGCSLSEPYALQVLGNEMEPEFPDQCIVVIRPEDSCTDGMHVFVEVEGVKLGGVLASGVVPEHDPLGGEATLKDLPDGGQVTHLTPPVRRSS